MKDSSDHMQAKAPFRSLRPLAWIILIILPLSALAMVFIPAWIVQPFKPQSQRAMEVSYILRRWSPLVTLIDSAILLALAAALWRGARMWWRKSILILIPIISLAPAWFARQNHFEWMFNPLSNPDYAKISEADFVDDADMVIAVENNGEAAAYPVRQMAYHHVVQDVVGGVPIVVTY